MNKDRETWHILTGEIVERYMVHPCRVLHDEIEGILVELQAKNEWLVKALNQSAKHDKDALFEIAKNYQHWKSDAFKPFFENKDNPILAFDPESFHQELNQLVNSQPVHKVREQKKARFYATAHDAATIKFIKTTKRLFYKISIIPSKVANGFRKLFRKKEKKIRYWKYAVPWRALIGYHTENVLINRLTEATMVYAHESVSTLKIALQLEQEMNKMLMDGTLHHSPEGQTFDDLRLDLLPMVGLHEEKLKVCESSVKAILQQTEKDIATSADLCGTWEYPEFFLKYQNRRKRKNAAFKKLNQQNLGWGNTVFSLFEDWKIDQEIYNLNYFSKAKVELLLGEHILSNTGINDLLQVSKAKIEQYNKILANKIIKNTNDPAGVIREEIAGYKAAIGSDDLNKATELLISYNLPGSINLFESKINQFLREISEKRWLTKLTEYDKPLGASDLNSFSPRELISFEYIPKLNASCGAAKSRVIQQVEVIQQMINSIDQVVAFNLSSIIESIEKSECASTDIPTLLEEGLNRAKNKIDEIILTNQSLEKEMMESLQLTVKQFNDATLTLTVNEDAFNLRMIIMKAKALKKSEEFGLDLLKHLKTVYAVGLRNFSQILSHVEQRLLPWKIKMGLGGQAGAIDTQLTDFLMEVNQKINDLPIIYQRLYKIMPLTEMSLFTGRVRELEEMLRAYKSWRKGKYSPTVIVGEKWSGQTTLINYFIETQVGQNNVVYIDRLEYSTDESELVRIWQEILGDAALNSFADIAIAIKSRYAGKVFVMENLQTNYLRTIQGFNYLKTLMKLISETSKDVFWLCSANKYSWQYFDKTIEMSSFFGYVIGLNPFSDNELRELIMKKNSISGYRIYFIPTLKDVANKKFARLNEEEKQLFLRDKFFSQLNNFAHGNISLALSYWLLSTTNITDRSIEITAFKSPDFSFINNLSQEKIFFIYLLIMHDGLTLDRLVAIYNKSEESLRLMMIMLRDDGIIIEKSSRFVVNPLIYRHTINMLKAKNLIY